MRVEISVDTSAAQRLLAALGQRAQNMGPAFREIGAGIVADAQLGFRDSRDPYGVPWKPLAFATRLARARKAAGPGALTKAGTLKAAPGRRFVGAFTTAKPLLDTGRLRNSITFTSGQSFADIGSNLRYAAVQQFGGKAGRGKKATIPARPFIATSARGLPRSYGEIVRDALARHFAGARA